MHNMERFDRVSQDVKQKDLNRHETNKIHVNGNVTNVDINKTLILHFAACPLQHASEILHSTPWVI